MNIDVSTGVNNARIEIYGNCVLHENTYDPATVIIIIIDALSSICVRDEPCHFSFAAQERRQAPELFIRVTPIGGLSQIRINVTYAGATCRPFPKEDAPFCSAVFAANERFNIVQNPTALDKAAEVYFIDLYSTVAMFL